ncbi:hypothetical protein [Streptomyces mayteni]
MTGPSEESGLTGSGDGADTTDTSAALEDVIKRRKRASFLAWVAEGGLPDLTGPVEARGGGE